MKATDISHILFVVDFWWGKLRMLNTPGRSQMNACIFGCSNHSFPYLSLALWLECTISSVCIVQSEWRGGGFDRETISSSVDSYHMSMIALIRTIRAFIDSFANQELLRFPTLLEQLSDVGWTKVITIMRGHLNHHKMAKEHCRLHIEIRILDIFSITMVLVAYTAQSLTERTSSIQIVNHTKAAGLLYSTLWDEIQ